MLLILLKNNLTYKMSQQKSTTSGGCKCPPPKNGYGCPCQDTLTLHAPGKVTGSFSFVSHHQNYESYYTWTYGNDNLVITKAIYPAAIPGEVFPVYVHIAPEGNIYTFNVQVKPTGIKLVGPPAT